MKDMIYKIKLLLARQENYAYQLYLCPKSYQEGAKEDRGEFQAREKYNSQPLVSCLPHKQAYKLKMYVKVCRQVLVSWCCCIRELVIPWCKNAA